MKYSINFFYKILIFLFFCVFTMFIFILGYQSYVQKTLIWVGFELVFIAMSVYMAKMFIAISRENLKLLSVDTQNKTFICTTKKNQVFEIAYNDVECVSITKGEIIRGIVLGQISIITKQGEIHRITVSNIDRFSLSIAKDLTIDFKESLFFQAK